MRGTNDGSGATPLVLMVRGVVLDAPPEIVRATVRERACRLGRTTLDVCFGARDEEALEALLGRQGSLLALGPASRAVHGIFTRVAIVGRRRRLDGLSGVEVRLTLEPQLARARRRRGYRIWSDASPIEVVTALLDEHRVPHRLRLRAPYPKREHTVQHDETDLALVQRLLGEHGVATFLDHPLQEGAHDRTGVGASDVVVLCDHPPYYQAIEGDPTLLYRPGDPRSGLTRDERHVLSCRLDLRAAPETALVRAYDPRRPRLELRSEASASAGRTQHARPELYYFGGVGDESPPDATLAAVELERARRDTCVLTGVSLCVRLTPGRCFELVDHPHAAANGRWVLVEVEHHVDAHHAELPYHNRFRAIPAERAIRPGRRHKPAAPTAETGVVVGPHGQDLHVDELGRVRVQLAWDTDGALDGRASAWLRSVQAWAGTGYGTQLIPRVGMEVLVHYLGGDIDRPVVAGALYNATHPPPFPISASPARSGLRTQSTPGGRGFNELSFEDRAGGELVQLIAQRDRFSLVRHDHRERVEHDQSSEVANDRSARVGRDDLVEVGRHHEVRVAGSETSAAMRAGAIQQSTGSASLGMSRDVALEAAGNMSLKAAGSVSVSGATISISSTGDVTIEAAGNLGIRAGGDVRIEAGGNISLDGSEIVQRGAAIREN